MSISVTIIGAGHYANDLILDKYLGNAQVEVKSGVDPCNRLISAPTVSNVEEWVKEFGAPTREDVFDLCVHQQKLLEIIEELVVIGAKNLILPKPVALKREEWDRIVALKTRYDLRITVASQWFYSEFVAKLKSFVQNVNIEKAIFCFSQHYKQKEYNLSNALLPHVLQLCYSLGLNLAHVSVERNAVQLFVRDHVVEFHITSYSKIRRLFLYHNGYETRIDFLNTVEDNLKIMVDRTIDYFLSNDESKVLTLEKYKSIALQQIEIEEYDQR